MMARVIARLMARVGLVTPEQRAWAWYDWANSVYFTTVITAVFPSFYATYAAAGLEPAQATARFGLITTLSVLVVAIISPVLGALADYSGIKKKLLALFMSIGILACASMVLHHRRQHRASPRCCSSSATSACPDRWCSTTRCCRTWRSRKRPIASRRPATRWVTSAAA